MAQLMDTLSEHAAASIDPYAETVENSHDKVPLLIHIPGAYPVDWHVPLQKLQSQATTLWPGWWLRIGWQSWVDICWDFGWHVRILGDRGGQELFDTIPNGSINTLNWKKHTEWLILRYIIVKEHFIHNHVFLARRLGMSHRSQNGISKRNNVRKKSLSIRSCITSHDLFALAYSCYSAARWTIYMNHKKVFGKHLIKCCADTWGFISKAWNDTYCSDWRATSRYSYKGSVTASGINREFIADLWFLMITDVITELLNTHLFDMLIYIIYLRLLGRAIKWKPCGGWFPHG